MLAVAVVAVMVRVCCVYLILLTHQLVVRAAHVDGGVGVGSGGGGGDVLWCLCVGNGDGGSPYLLMVW